MKNPKIKKINNVLNCGIKKSKNKKSYKISNNFNMYYKINKNKNYLVINKFFFESDLFKEKKNIKKMCSKINTLVFKNLYLNINNKKKIKKKLKYLSIKTNEKVFLKTKILKNKYFSVYLHMNKNLCAIKTEKILNSKDIILNVFFYKIRKINILSKKSNIFNKSIIGNIKNFNHLKKIYFF